MLSSLREWAPYELGEVTDEELTERARVEGPSIELRTDVRPLVIPNWSEEVANQALARHKEGAG